VIEEERRARATLTYIAEPGDPLLGRIVGALGAAGAVRAVRAGTPPDEMAETTEWRRLLARRFRNWRVRLPAADVNAGLTACERFGGRLVCPGDPEWPVQLDDLEDRRPYALWVRGARRLADACARAVSVVGARAATPYGVHVAAEMAVELANRGWGTVSGGAFGIDAAAHRGSLAGDALTVAVLACGVDQPYPRSNHGLFQEIGSRGVLVSEWPPGAHPTRPRFLVRNRVIAALSRGTVVVEAGRRSGAVNTAGHAVDLGRSVMAVPGPVTSRQSVGCHGLLRDGAAVCVTDAADVIEQVGRMGDDLAPARRGPVRIRDTLDPTTVAVLEALPARGEMGPAEISVAAGVEVGTVIGCLGRLAAAGLAERRRGGWRVRRGRADEER
jgi:DNA processing protein